jgi:hypothetical protein
VHREGSNSALSAFLEVALSPCQALAENSETFGKKTAFSKQKWTTKKLEK